MNVLVVRLGALGDIIHTLPAVAALRAAYPSARIDWLVEARHREILDLVPAVDRIVVVREATMAAWLEATRQLRGARYDVALDFQGLMKSAVLARASGAKRVLGFSIWHLREKGARPFYSEGVDVRSTHVIHKNLRLLEALGIERPAIEFPLLRVDSHARDTLVTQAAGAPIALINPGAAWPNKRWPAQRFGELAAFLREVRGMAPFVLWGPDEEALAREVAAASSGAARIAPPTRLADVVEVCRVAALVVSGDTGPLHIAAAAGAPTVSIFGPTDPARNGSWVEEDVVISRFESCRCHYDRRCHHAAWCLDSIGVPEVAAAVQQRLAGQW
ncbi:MAG TPA: lipopolysaccharide heptosyltransferase I [Vicinamibacterales bacterium]|nr:lipopolysaccharide heptosyltransferase I [Vicinamibacterales bacterium]